MWIPQRESGRSNQGVYQTQRRTQRERCISLAYKTLSPSLKTTTCNPLSLSQPYLTIVIYWYLQQQQQQQQQYQYQTKPKLFYSILYSQFIFSKIPQILPNKPNYVVVILLLLISPFLYLFFFYHLYLSLIDWLITNESDNRINTKTWLQSSFSIYSYRS